MNRRRRVFLISLIILLLVVAGGVYYLFFSGNFGIFADLITGPEEEVVASQTAEEILSGAEVQTEEVILGTWDENHTEALMLKPEAETGLVYGSISPEKITNIRRFLWEGRTFEGSEAVLWTCLGDVCSDSSDWTKSSGTEIGQNIDQVVEKVSYIIYFSRNLSLTAEDEATRLLSLANQDINLVEDSTTLTTQANLTEEKKAYAHLFIDGEDKGRYLGAIVDISGLKNNFLFSTFLTDTAAFVSEKKTGERLMGNAADNTRKYKNEQFVSDLQNRAEVKFVDEDTDQAVGEAVLSVKSDGDWVDQGKFISSMVSVAGSQSSKRNTLWITDEDAYVGDMSFGGGIGGHSNSAETNTRIFKAINSPLDYMQENVRVKFQPLAGVNAELIDDGVGAKDFANIMVDGGNKGDFVGVGVEISGRHSDLFYPIWISSNDVEVGATEYIDEIFTGQDSSQNSQSFDGLNSSQTLRDKVAIYASVASVVPGHSPAIYQIGLSTGYKATEDGDDRPAQDVSGWDKNNLLKTGADLLVLAVITLLIVVAIVYLSSLLKNNSGPRPKQQDIIK